MVSATDKVMSNRQPPLTADFLIHEAEAIRRFVARVLHEKSVRGGGGGGAGVPTGSA